MLELSRRGGWPAPRRVADAGGFAPWWAAWAAASSPVASSPLRIAASCPQPPDPIPEQRTDASWLVRNFKRLVALVACGTAGWLQGASNLDPAVLLAADLLLLPSRRFVANISKLAGGQDASPSPAKNSHRRLANSKSRALLVMQTTANQYTAEELSYFIFPDLNETRTSPHSVEKFRPM